jgi:hypothetical protein
MIKLKKKLNKKKDWVVEWLNLKYIQLKKDPENKSG